jgi:hypothetical protein
VHVTDHEIAARLREVLCAAKARSGWSTAWATNTLIDHVAASMAPLLREMVAEAVAAHVERGAA